MQNIDPSPLCFDEQFWTEKQENDENNFWIMYYASENTSLHALTCVAFCVYISWFIACESNTEKTISWNAME